MPKGSLCKAAEDPVCDQSILKLINVVVGRTIDERAINTKKVLNSWERNEDHTLCLNSANWTFLEVNYGEVVLSGLWVVEVGIWQLHPPPIIFRGKGHGDLQFIVVAAHPPNAYYHQLGILSARRKGVGKLTQKQISISNLIQVDIAEFEP
ncbi:hypothetical protein ACFE04_001707 [Oxalis oulophora]